MWLSQKQILEKYDPSRVENGDLERLLERYQGNEEELIERLCRKYNLTTAHTEAIASMIELGPSVTQSVRLRSKEKDDTIAIKHKLAKIYGAYDRRMLRVLDAEMSRNKGRERAYLEATMRKYKVTYDWLEKVGNAEDLSDNLEDGASRRKSVSSRKLNSTFVNQARPHTKEPYTISMHIMRLISSAMCLKFLSATKAPKRNSCPSYERSICKAKVMCRYRGGGFSIRIISTVE